VFRSRPVSLALVGLFVWVTACTSYKQIEVGEVSHHGKVRVTLTDGERETLRDPWVDGDSIKAYTSESVGNLGPQQRVTDILAIPLDQVAELGAVSTDEVGTVFTVLGILVVAGALMVAVGCNNTSGQCFNVY
jgi:hypothetical protein